MTDETEITGAARVTLFGLDSHFARFIVEFENKSGPDGTPTLLRTRSTGYADAQNATHRDPISGDENGWVHTVTIHMGMLSDVTNDGNKIDQPPASGSGGVGHSFPRHPMLSADRTSVGWDCLPHDDDAGTEAPGRLYLAERAGDDPPKLVAIWRPDYYSVNASERAPVDYHLYFTPNIPGDAVHWGDYPYGYGDATIGHAQGYVHLLYRHMFWEMRLAHQTCRARRKTLTIIPCGRQGDNLGSLPTCSNVHRLLKEANMFVQFLEGVPYSAWLLQDVGRVALSGFSAGMDFVMSVMNATGGDAASSPPNPAGLGQELFDVRLKEVYNFDGNPGVDAFRGTVDTAWRRGSADRAFRVYNQSDAWFDSFKDIGGATTIRYDAFRNTVEGEAHSDDGSRSVVVLPGPFLEWVGVTPDPHHWMPRYVAYHALSRSRFSQG